jgi:serpin B
MNARAVAAITLLLAIVWAGVAAIGQEVDFDIAGRVENVQSRESGNQKYTYITVRATAKSTYDIAVVAISSETSIFTHDRKPASAECIMVGLEVGVIFDGPVAESYPIQAKAKEVCILDDVAAIEKMKSVAKSNNIFAVELYTKLAGLARKRDGNLFFSPASISTALAMTYAGARGKTAGEMRNVLRFSLKGEELHPAMSEMARRLDSEEPGLELSIANSLWGQKGYGFLKEFLDLNRTNYGAGLNEVDFLNAPDEARKEINHWVEDRTGNRIRELLKKEHIKSDTTLVLVNAIYFKGIWLYQFEKADTKKQPFHLTKEKTVQADMMHLKNAELKYCKGESFAALELPYEGEKCSMLILLPDEMDGLERLEDPLTRENLDTWLSRMQKQKITEVTLPRFKMTKDFSLSDTLIEMGMSTAFGGGADFSGMTGRKDLFIGAIVHKAFVDVNEEGTEAAAATAVVMKRGAAPRPVVFTADHPFMFIVRDNLTGVILFMGRVSDPTGGSE